jgi:putative DNA primase/helicase
MMTTVTDDFRQAIEAAGLTPPHTLIADGNLHRFCTNGKPDDDSGWYVLHGDGIPAGVFGDWRRDLKQTWCSKTDRQMTSAEREHHRQRVALMQQQRQEDERRRQAEAKERAVAMLQAAQLADDDHPYLQRKHVHAFGLFLHNDGRLIVPVCDTEDHPQSLQLIDDDGHKLFLPGGRTQGLFHLIGTVRDVLCFAEGYATAASIHEATGYPVAVAFSANNLLPVALLLRAKYPTIKFLICGDHDTSGVGQQKAQEAAEAIQGTVCLPETVGDDWNDVHVRSGLEAVRRAIMATKQPTQEATGMVSRPAGRLAPVRASQLLDEPEAEQPTWLWEEFIPEGALLALVAKPKVGKTTLAYELAAKLVQGLPFLGRATRSSPVLIIAVEEHPRDINRRLRAMGADALEDLHVHRSRLDDDATTFHDLAQYIREHGLKLVIFDTLNSFWSVQEENDAIGVTNAVKPLLALARETGAAVLLLHHARKSEGEYGDEIRGSGALFSLLDAALILKRHDVETQRTLTTISRYPDTPSELILELRDHGYECLGDPSAVGKQAKLAKLLAALTAEPMEVKDLAKKAGVPPRSAYPLLEQLYQEAKAHRTGDGKRKSPFKYSFRAYKEEGSHATNPPNGSLRPPASDFVSCHPPLLEGATKHKTSPFVSCDPRTPTRNESDMFEGGK